MNRIRQAKLKLLLVYLLFIIVFLIFFARDIYDFCHIVVTKDFHHGVLFLKELKIKGALLLGSIQFLQIMFGLFPSEFVQITSMVIYNPFIGFIICYIGSVIGIIAVYLIVKYSKTRYYESRHRDTIEVLDVKSRHTKNLLHKAVNMYTYIFVPIGAISYYFARKKIKFSKYLLISMVAIIPSLITTAIISQIVIYLNKISILLVVIAALFLSIIIFIRNYFDKLNVAYKKNISLKPNKFAFKLVRLFGTRKYREKYNVVYNLDSIKDIKTPFVCICNHPSRFDYVFALEGLINHQFNFLVDKTYFYEPRYRNLLISLGAIPYNVFKLDIFCIKAIKKTLQENRSILIMPEGNISILGEKGENLISLGKLLKNLNVDVVNLKIEGASYTCGKFFKKKRVGQVTITANKLFDSKDLCNYKNNEIDEIINNKMYYDDYSYVQTRKDLFYESQDISENLDSLLFVCPTCKSQFTLKTKNNHIVCKKCAYDAQINKRYEIFNFDDEESINIDSLPKFHDFQYKFIEKLIVKKNFYYQESVIVRAPMGKKGYLKEIGEGICSIDKNNFIFTGKFNGERKKITIPIDKLNLNISGIKNEVQIFYDKEFFAFKSTENHKSCIKWYYIYTVLKDLEKKEKQKNEEDVK